MSTPAPGRRADWIANRRAILEASLRLLGRDPQATLAQIAAEAGLTRRTVYLHFSSREDLIAAAAGDIGEQIAARAAAVADSGEPLMTLATFVRANSAAVAQLHRLGPLSSVPGARDQLNAATAAVRERIAALLADAQSRGQLDTHIPTRAGMHTAAAVQWGVFEAVAQGDLTPECAPATAVRAVLGSVGVHPATTESIMLRLDALAENSPTAESSVPSRK
ncbi:TetR/AcrR family transcriptional regulator [Nocardia vaccinii]|uniref:TetR/AcrR family transcriptional regulator n=1 Tax=Nocardia vaccinii TaxID=1822 RepID=UPI0008358503|nr:TetR/AcrR family transcriptional regulator [Nocardia vaccinii]